ncbi:hypothetical protein [Aliarcobacter cryaerophilus]|uniref:hypothetical protein n=1 Tax=Aliarcobacter cryaerophilus TaxID=28198 RepID=UPI0021B23F6E|nr:hypothetical protein [Aliarcobacter cryaerophilus]MCT7498939.1 hypothetical protein [Aliarcobacter cryaerophilus]MCT7542897.1 hypothetical protein [Aliarcobacter cryaerophilus]
MQNDLVNAVQCAKIITNKLNRKVDRSYITKLANENRIPYEVFEGKKIFNPQYVLDNLPAERLVASKFEDDVTQLKIIEEFIADGGKVNFNKQRPKKLFSNPNELCRYLPIIEELTIDDIRKALKKINYNNEIFNNGKIELITDSIIQKYIDENRVDYNTLNNFWKYRKESEGFFISDFDKETETLSYRQELMLFHMIIYQFPRANFIADWCLEEILD